ncbi:hypothetical protein [Ornithinibacillus halotolerans]|uniref:Uncharacterized protein n=1 Tax=Ornithinibacillus halotolerans TaxID=1274357 RepID=A0A916WA11_9BACI|nr:hypothetical protein [Ornithinibacillus halotolerans]GGA79657.1 hypothetical protein GCM10008025_23820 [Ornithinibacillus halotolerans]
MDASVWQIISIVGYSLAGILFLVAIIMFFKLDIWAIIGDLTGRTAAKQIERIREENSKTGQKRYGPSAFNIERGELTEPITKSKKLKKSANTWRFGRRHKTEDFTEKLPDNTQVLVDSGESMADGTQVLADGTDVLNNGTEVLPHGTQVLTDDTEVLHEGTQVLAMDSDIPLSEGTQVLHHEQSYREASSTTVLEITEDLTDEEHPSIKQDIDFKIMKDVKITHTEEIL